MAGNYWVKRKKMSKIGADVGYLHLLQSRRFLPFLVSQAMTNFGDGLFAVVVIYMAVKLNATSTELGIIAFCMAFPRGLLGPLGGVIADKTDRRRLLIGIESTRTAVLLLVPVASTLHLLDIWSVAALGAIVSALFSMGSPAAKAYIPKLVAPGELQLANSLGQAIVWPAYFIGAGVLALVGNKFAAADIFYVVALCFGLSLLALLVLPRGERIAGTGQLSIGTIGHDLKLGYLILLENPVLHARVVLYGVFTFAWRGLLQVLLPLLVLRQMPEQIGLYGTLMLVNGCGELAANLVVGKIQFRRPLVQSFNGELIIGTAALLVAYCMAMPDPRYGLYAAVFLIGVAASMIDIPMFTVVQREIPEQHLAKVISYWFTIGSFGGAMGTLVCGYLLAYASIGTLCLAGGAGLLLAGTGMLLWARGVRAGGARLHAAKVVE
jgi:DHA3 family macrolide efflux protein-like MFS transporter